MSKFAMRLLAGSAAAMSLSGAAQAAVTFQSFAESATLPTGFTMVYDYDHPAAAGYSQVGGQTSQPPLNPGVSAPPLGTAAGTNYAFVETNGMATLYTPLITAFSVYIGSIDSYNEISFYNGASMLGWFGGDQLAPPTANGDQGAAATNQRFVFNFNGQKVDRVVFFSRGNSMEWDSIAAPISAVPEPATWAMMITGFGLMGAALRRRRSQPGAIAT